MNLQCDNLSGELQDQWSSCLNTSRKLTKSVSKNAFYVNVNIFLLSNFTVLKAERYHFVFIFVCRTSKFTHMEKNEKKKKIKKILPCGLTRQLRTSGFKSGLIGSTFKIITYTRGDRKVCIKML